MEANTFHYYLLRLGKIFLCVFYFHPDLILYESKREKKKKSSKLWPKNIQALTTDIPRTNNEETYEACKIMQEFISQ